MKWMIASDIHGSEKYCRMLLEKFKEENADRLLLLGDILYHGPRNDLPERYAPKAVLAMLNEQKTNILCVRGNCDTEVDQMVLDFPIMADYAVLEFGNRFVYASHGHVFHPEHLPPLKKGDVFLYGHTHIPDCREKNGILCVNPGSVSIPKNGSLRGYMTFEGNEFVWRSLEGIERNRCEV